MPRRRAVLCSLPLVASLALVPVPGASAEPEPPVLRSTALEVRLGAEFPRVVGYTDLASGATLGGQPSELDAVVVNGERHRTELVGEVDVEGPRAAYRLAVPELPGLEVLASLTVEASTVRFAVEELSEPDGGVVNTLELPDHSLVSVSSADAGAQTAFTTLDPDSTTTADRFAQVTPATEAQAAPTGATYAMLNTDSLAASIETNATVDDPEGAEVDDGTRLHHRAVADTAAGAGVDDVRVGLWSGEWTVRGETATEREELPWAEVVLTGDANDDDEVDWQDAAVAFRDIMIEPAGAEETADRVITRIPFNFASQATHPFLRTLDDTKRISLATDGLGQTAVLKGYGAEGHDSAHPDYGGNYNERAGGLDDLNTLLAEGEEWNTTFRVHVNATEAYGEADAFDEELVDPGSKGWNWLNQSYYIDQRHDLASGDVLDRFAQLREETHPNLTGLYIDVYYSSGWLADGLTRRLAEQGWEVSTEWADRFERSSLWSHWANDLDYGGATNKGLNSQIIRFVRNHEKDVWNDDPILGQTSLVDFEGWTGEVDQDAFLANVWQTNLPTKFLQQQQILDWSDDEIRFTGDVTGRVEDGVRTVSVGSADVIRGDAYLLPWASADAEQPDKLYHWDPEGGRSTWDVPAPFTDVRTFQVHALSEHGRERVDVAVNRRGTLTLDAEPGTAYVLTPERSPAPAEVQWGQGTGLVDPGFNATDLTAWNPAGDTSIATLDTGVAVAELGEGAASLSQPVRGLQAGTEYAASAWVEVEPGQSRDTTVSVTGGAEPAEVTIARSTAQNLVAADEKHGTFFQRVVVPFTATGETAQLAISAADGSARVRVDDVRVVPATDPTEGGDTVVAADFEDVDQGWWPFVKGDAGGTTDPRTHLATRHEPYTQRGWNGKRVDDALSGDWSLKAHEENAGLVYRTVPQSASFTEGHAYRVEFDHQSGRSGQYEWVVGTDRVVDGEPTSVDLQRTPLPEQLSTSRFSQELVVGCGGDSWVGLRKLTGGGDQADLVLDDLQITDLGPAEGGPTCSSLSLGGAGLAAMVQGEPNPVTTTLTNHGDTAITDVELGLDVPEGWSVEPASEPVLAEVAPGAEAVAEWSVTPATDAEPGQDYPVTASASYTTPQGPVRVSRDDSAGVLAEGIVPQSRISIESVSSTEPGDGSVTNVLDGDPSTIWHTAWSQVEPDADYPHEVVLDLGAEYEVDGFRYLPRQVGTNGRMKDFELYVGSEPSAWGEPVATGSFTDGTEETLVELDPARARYVRLVGLSSQNGGVFGGAAELNVLGNPVG